MGCDGLGRIVRVATAISPHGIGSVAAPTSVARLTAVSSVANCVACVWLGVTRPLQDTTVPRLSGQLQRQTSAEGERKNGANQQSQFSPANAAASLFIRLQISYRPDEIR
jgi:hypothetical protein